MREFRIAPNCDHVIENQTIDQIIDAVLDMKAGTKVMILAPVVQAKKGHHKDVLQEIERQGFVRVRINGDVQLLETALQQELGRYNQHTIEVVVDRLVIPDKKTF